MYGALLMAPMIQELRSQVRAAVHLAPVSAIPNSWGNDRFAPLEPVWSQPWIAAPMEFRTMVKYSVFG